ncbi:hypothetical protein [Parasphingorhabdus sp.]|uniref:hypothetical protein n=1 Tax=Parasphingorhabdus sp. TaxID=2709688 RepID=UPI003A944A56
MFSPQQRRPGNLSQFLGQLQSGEQGATLQPVPMDAQQTELMQQPAPQDNSRRGPQIGGIFGRNRTSQQPPLQRPESLPDTRSKHIFGKGGVGWDVMGTIGDTLLQRNGNAPVYAPYMKQKLARRAEQEKSIARQQWEYDMAQQQREWMAQDKDAAQRAPQVFMSNGDRVQFDPVSGESTVLYDGQEPFEDYAQGLGLEPGTPEYTRALQDYVLKSSGPTANDYDVKLDGVRTSNDISRKQAPTYRQSNPRPRAAPRGRTSSRRPAATGPGGKRIEWDGKAWVAAN